MVIAYICSEFSCSFKGEFLLPPGWIDAAQTTKNSHNLIWHLWLKVGYRFRGRWEWSCLGEKLCSSLCTMRRRTPLRSAAVVQYKRGLPCRRLIAMSSFHHLASLSNCRRLNNRQKLRKSHNIATLSNLGVIVVGVVTWSHCRCISLIRHFYTEDVVSIVTMNKFWSLSIWACAGYRVNKQYSHSR